MVRRPQWIVSPKLHDFPGYGNHSIDNRAWHLMISCHWWDSVVATTIASQWWLTFSCDHHLLATSVVITMWWLVPMWMPMNNEPSVICDGNCYEPWLATCLATPLLTTWISATCLPLHHCPIWVRPSRTMSPPKIISRLANFGCQLLQRLLGFDLLDDGWWCWNCWLIIYVWKRLRSANNSW